MCHCAQDTNIILIPVPAQGGTVPNNACPKRVYRTLAEEEVVVVRYQGGERGCAGEMMQ